MRPRAPRRWPAGPAPRCPRTRSGRRARAVDRRCRSPRRLRRTRSSAARRTRRSWAGGPCGRSHGSRRRPARPRSCKRPLPARGSRRPRPCRASRPRARCSAAAASREEVLAQQQILGRVAGERELGKQHQVGALRQRRLAPGADALGVGGDVADRGVHLTEGQAHLSSRVRCARRRCARRRLCACAALRRSWPAVWRAGSRRPRGRASRSPT